MFGSYLKIENWKLKIETFELIKLTTSALLVFIMSFSPILPSFKLEHFKILGALTSAASYITWTGAGEDNRWSNPDNWSANNVPGAEDIATFNDTNIKNAVVTSDINVAGIAIQRGYTGSLSFISDQTATIGINGINQSDGTFNSGDTKIAVRGSINLSAGTFTASSSTLSIGGNLSIFTSNFNHNNGTIILNGIEQVVFGSAAFNNFIKQAEVAQTLELQSGSYLTFTGDLNLQGTITGLLKIQSSTEGAPATLNPLASVITSYLSVKDINNASLSPIDCTTGCLKDGNSTGWIFPEISAHPTATSSISGVIDKTKGLLPSGAPHTDTEIDPSPSLQDLPTLADIASPSPVKDKLPQAIADSKTGPLIETTHIEGPLKNKESTDFGAEEPVSFTIKISKDNNEVVLEPVQLEEVTVTTQRLNNEPEETTDPPALLNTT